MVLKKKGRRRKIRHWRFISTNFVLCSWHRNQAFFNFRGKFTKLQ